MNPVRSAITLLSAAALLVGQPQTAFADSDGYFCVGPDYLAYQFGLAAPPIAPHRLFVVRLTLDGLGADTVSINLPQFQVHGMLCDASTIRIASFTAIYTIRLDSERHPTGVSSAPSAAGVPMEFVRSQRDNLSGAGYRPGVSKWGSTFRKPVGSGPASFALEFVPDSIKPDPCTVVVTASLIALGSQEEALRARRVFRGPAHRECGDDQNAPMSEQHNGRLLLSARAFEAAGSLRSPAALFMMRRSRSATR